MARVQHATCGLMQRIVAFGADKAEPAKAMPPEGPCLTVPLHTCTATGARSPLCTATLALRQTHTMASYRPTRPPDGSGAQMVALFASAYTLAHETFEYQRRVFHCCIPLLYPTAVAHCCYSAEEGSFRLPLGVPCSLARPMSEASPMTC